MSADLKAVHAKLANTIASPLTATRRAHGGIHPRRVQHQCPGDPLLA
jgi:hypothetical protein